jgi:hypothetical protein
VGCQVPLRRLSSGPTLLYGCEDGLVSLSLGLDGRFTQFFSSGWSVDRCVEREARHEQRLVLRLRLVVSMVVCHHCCPS